MSPGALTGWPWSILLPICWPTLGAEGDNRGPSGALQAWPVPSPPPRLPGSTWQRQLWKLDTYLPPLSTLQCVRTQTQHLHPNLVPQGPILSFAVLIGSSPTLRPASDLLRSPDYVSLPPSICPSSPPCSHPPLPPLSSSPTSVTLSCPHHPPLSPLPSPTSITLCIFF